MGIAKSPEITILGLCGECNTWVEVASGAIWLPHHKMEEDGIECPNFGMKIQKYRYLLKTHDEALRVANLISEGKDDCLFRQQHSAVCHHGKLCTKARTFLVQALAVYFLENFPEPPLDVDE